MPLCDNSRPPIGTQEVYMNIFINILNKQIEQIKDNISTLLGNCNTALEFSEVPLFTEEIELHENDEAELIEINKKLQILRNILIDIKEEIYKL